MYRLQFFDKKMKQNPKNPERDFLEYAAVEYGLLRRRTSDE